MMAGWLVVNPIFPTLMACGLLFLLTVFVVWLEWKRRARYLSLRLIASVVMVLSVAGFVLRPRYPSTTSEQILLLTRDYSKSQVDSLLNIYPALKLLHAPGADGYRNSMALKSYHDLSHELQNVIFITGQGLPGEALDLFPSHNYQFIPAPFPEGIVKLTLPENIVQNRTVTIEGLVNNRSDTSKLILSGPGGKEDSISVSKNGLQSFALSFVPKSKGKFLYTLHSNDKTIGKIPIPVREPEQLNILFIQHYPTFETRYLKEFLARKHSLLLRHRLSLDRFRYEFFNRKTESIDRLTRTSLSAFDLIIIDTDALHQLRPSEKTALQAAIQDGLGMLPIFNSPPAVTQKIIPFNLEKWAADTAHLFFSGGKKAVLPAWQLQIGPEPGVHPIVKNQTRTLAGYRYQGFGRTGFQLLQETYRLLLQGDSLAYSEFWSQVVENVSRSRSRMSAVWREETTFPLYADVPINFKIISSDKRPEVFLDDVQLPGRENNLIDDLWMFKLWTDREGWHYLSSAGDTVLALYTSNRDEWRSLAIANARQATRAYSASVAQQNKVEQIFKPIPLWIFYLLFLMSAGFLWLAARI